MTAQGVSTPCGTNKDVCFQRKASTYCGVTQAEPQNWSYAPQSLMCALTTYKGLGLARVAGARAKRYQNKAACIGCLMAIVVAVSVHGSSVMETTDPSHTELTGTWLRDNTNFESAGTLENTAGFAVSVTDSRPKENTDTTGTAVLPTLCSHRLSAGLSFQASWLVWT